jgi:hypothetical protein
MFFILKVVIWYYRNRNQTKGIIFLVRQN